MTAWDILTTNSTAPNGSDAWTHLNNQAGGGGILAGGFGLKTNLQESTLTIAASEQALLIDIDKNTLIINDDNDPIITAINKVVI